MKYRFSIWLSAFLFSFNIDAQSYEGEFSPAFSPDGKFLAYHKNSKTIHWDIFVRDVSSGVETQITDTGDMEVEPSWSADGRQLVYAKRINGDWDIFVYDFKQKSHLPLIVNKGMDNAPKWSPDGHSIIFVSSRTGNAQLFKMDLETGTTQQLTHSSLGVSHPSWNLDNSSVLFDQYYKNSEHSGSGRSEIFQLDLSTLEITNLYRNPASSIAATKNGNHLFVTTNRAGNWDVIKINLNTQMETPIANSANNEMKATFNQQTQQLAYINFDENGVSKIVIKSLKQSKE